MIIRSRPTLPVSLMAELTPARRGFMCGEVSVELVQILDRAYGFSRNRIATVFEKLSATKEIHLETADYMIRTADSYRRGGPDFAERMIAAAAKRSSAETLYILGRENDQFWATALSPTART